MAEDTKASSIDSEVQQSGKEEAALDGEFIKVDKELIDAKETSPLTNQQVVSPENSGVEELGSAAAISNRNSILEEKIKELELRLAHSVSEKASLTSDCDIANEKLEKMNKNCEELELEQKTMKDQIIEVQQKHNLLLGNLEEASTARDIKHKELLDIKESFTALSAELETSRDKMKEFEAELVSSAAKMQSLEELNRKSSLQVELESKRASELEKMLELAQLNAKKMEDQLDNFKYESRTALETATKRNFELENVIKDLNATEERMKAQARESEMTSASTEKRIRELEQQLELANAKCLEADKTNKVLKDKIEKVNSSLREVDEESSLLKCRYQGYEERIAQLESSLSKSLSSKSELEKELNNIVEKCAEHEGRANMIHQYSLELEDLIKASHSRAADAEKRVGELEQLLEVASSQTKHLEDLLSSTETKQRDAEAESRQCRSNVSELSVELEACQVQIVNLHAVLQAANGKERELTDILHASDKERKNFEELSIIQGKNLLESENLVHELQTEVKSLKEKMEHVEENLEASTVREKELQEKLQHAGEQLELHVKTVEEVNSRNLNLQTLHESVVIDSGLKLKEAEENLKQKLSETAELQENLKFFEEHTAHLKVQAAEANEEITQLKTELEANAMKLISLGNDNEELRQKASDAYLKVDQAFSESEMLSGTNSKLREELDIHQCKVDELNSLLNSIRVEKEATSEQLACHVETISKLSNEHSRVLELHCTTESSLKETEAQLNETIVKLKEKETEITNLNKEMLALEAQMMTCKEQANESAAVASCQKEKLEETRFQLQNLEGLVDKLTSEADQFKADKQQYTTIMEKQVEELKQKLKEAEAQNKEEAKSVTKESQLKDETEVKSRDLELDPSTLSRRKNKKTSENTYQAPERTSLNQTSHAAVEPPTAMAFKVILGVAIVSLILGVILGKRY